VNPSPTMHAFVPRSMHSSTISRGRPPADARFQS
jgi:hypothetical protein